MDFLHKFATKSPFSIKCNEHDETIGQFHYTVFRRICHVTSVTTWQKCMHRNFQYMLSKRMKKFYFILHKIFGKLKSKRMVTLLSHMAIAIMYLRNINYFYTTLQNVVYERTWKCWKLSIDQGYRRAFYLVNDVIKACEIDDLFRWKTWFQKWPIIKYSVFYLYWTYWKLDNKCLGCLEIL